MSEKTLSLQIKEAMKTALQNLPATSDGTEIMQVLTSGEDQFEKYPTIRILPQDYQRGIDSDRRRYTYTVTHVISIYLELGNGATTPDSNIIDTMQELVDLVYEKLDESTWLSEIDSDDEYGLSVAQNDSPVGIDVTNAQTGVALFADISYSVAYTKAF